MNRRTLLKLALAAAMAAPVGRVIGATRLRVVVAGAGIVGASIAYHLAKAGADVTVIDAVGPASGASRGTFAWINATWAKQPRHYHALNQDSLSDWQTLQTSLALPIRWGGSLEWFSDEARQIKLATQIDEQVQWGAPARMIDAAQFAFLEPNVTFSGHAVAAYSPNDGALDPVLATHKLLNAAVELGAVVHYPRILTGVSSTNGRLKSVATSQGSIPADRLVLATGAAEALPRKIAGIDIPQRSTPGVIAVTRPLPRVINRIIVAPGIHMHQRDDLRVVMGEQNGAPENQAHAARLADKPNDFPSLAFAKQHGDRILQVARQYVPQMVNAEIETAYIGWRPLPLDGHPVLGTNPKNPDIYLAIMHSGVSLAPIVGQLTAHELTRNTSIERLAPYRPTRRFERIRRY